MKILYHIQAQQGYFLMVSDPMSFWADMEDTGQPLKEVDGRQSLMRYSEIVFFLSVMTSSLYVLSSYSWKSIAFHPGIWDATIVSYRTTEKKRDTHSCL